MFWNETDEIFERLGRKIEAQKIENVNKIKAYGIRINQYNMRQKEKEKG